MSRIAKKPIKIPEGVSVSIEGNKVSLFGTKGGLTYDLPNTISAKVKDGELFLERKGDTKVAGSLHGLFYRLILGGVQGVLGGWKKTLELVGTGYRARMDGDKVVLNMGFSHPVVVEPPAGISFSLEENKVHIYGVDKRLVGQVAADIRKIRPPEPYKGKGIRYLGEAVRRKPGKAAKVGAVS